MAGVKFRRGDLVVAVLPGAAGKPRPMLVIQDDCFAETTSVTLLPVTSELVSAPLLRIAVEPSKENGLVVPSQIMVDKTGTVPRDKVRQRIGRLDDDIMMAVQRALAVFLGFA